MTSSVRLINKKRLFWGCQSILNMQANIIIFIWSKKVQNRKWWRADRLSFSSVMRFERYTILVEMDLKFSIFPELLQHCLLLTIIDIEPFNWFEFFEHVRFNFYRREDGFWNKIKSVSFTLIQFWRKQLEYPNRVKRSLVKQVKVWKRPYHSPESFWFVGKAQIVSYQKVQYRWSCENLCENQHIQIQKDLGLHRYHRPRHEHRKLHHHRCQNFWYIFRRLRTLGFHRHSWNLIQN